MKVLLGKNKTYRLIPRDWPPVHKRFVAWAMAPELAVLIALLVIFGISQPDMYRTDMWQIGFDNKLNSNPNMILYAYANHRPLPKIPLIWSLMCVSPFRPLTQPRPERKHRANRRSHLVG